MNPTLPFLSTSALVRGLRLTLVFCPILLATACATHGTLPARPPVPPAVLNLAATPNSAAEAVLVSIIRPGGRGSWQRDAAWDEFALRLTNRSSTPLQIGSASLEVTADVSLRPGDDPWVLEKQRRNWWQNAKSSTASQAAAYAVGAFVLGPGMLVGPVVAAPAYTAGFIGIHRQKARTTAEFQRRRLALPQTVAPGATITGSLFFSPTPQPQALVLRGEDAGGPFEVTFDLTAVIGPARTPPAAPARASGRGRPVEWPATTD